MSITIWTSERDLGAADCPRTLCSVFQPFDLDSSNQRQLGAPPPPEKSIPLALKPSQHRVENLRLEDIILAVKSLQSQNQLLTKQLALHGAILFRGLPIRSADDFSRFTFAFGFKPHEIIRIVVDRPILAPNIAPASEAPKEVLIHNHNEFPQVPHSPSYIFLCGHKAPSLGGETPISSSIELFQ
jgi:hypothetical protein